MKNEYIWSPQYTLHKTLLGLYHSVLYTKNETALSILGNAADWYLNWTADMQDKNPHVVYSGEEGGMLRYVPVYMKLQTTSVSSHSQNATPTRPFSKTCRRQ